MPKNMPKNMPKEDEYEFNTQPGELVRIPYKLKRG